MDCFARLAMTVRRDGGRRTQDATLVQTPVLIPSVEGCRPQAAGWFPRAVRGHLIFDI
ncbi:MAG: hypothetical protein LBM98_04915 [Oscillospiraceae bacterium]|nr:hypothetical protein [Oscillospiraceae bacterium]